MRPCCRPCCVPLPAAPGGAQQPPCSTESAASPSAAMAGGWLSLQHPARSRLFFPLWLLRGHSGEEAPRGPAGTAPTLGRTRFSWCPQGAQRGTKGRVLRCPGKRPWGSWWVSTSGHGTRKGTAGLSPLLLPCCMGCAARPVLPGQRCLQLPPAPCSPWSSHLTYGRCRGRRCLPGSSLHLLSLHRALRWPLAP